MSNVARIRERLKPRVPGLLRRQPDLSRLHRPRRRRDAARLALGERRDPRRVDRHAQLRQPRLRRRARGRQGPDRPGRSSTPRVSTCSASRAAIADLAERARTKKLLPGRRPGRHVHDHEPGQLRHLHGHADDQPAAVGDPRHLRDRQAAVGDPGRRGQDAIAIRSIMNLTLTYDHRLVDGAYGAQFLRDLAPAAPDLGRVGLLEAQSMTRGAYLMNLGLTDYEEAWELQRSLAAAVGQGAIPDTVLLLEHPPTVTLGRRTEEGEVHIPAGADVAVVETDRGGKSTYHGPGQLVCYPILDLKRHGKDVKQYCRDLEEAIIRTVGRVRARGDADRRAHRRLAPLAAAEDRVDRRPHQPLGHDARLRAERRSRPGAVHRLDHGLRARGRGVHVARARARPAGDGRRGARRPPRRRSPRSSASASTSCPATSRVSGPSRSTRSSRPAARPRARLPGPPRRSLPCGAGSLQHGPLQHGSLQHGRHGRSRDIPPKVPLGSRLR